MSDKHQDFAASGAVARRQGDQGSTDSGCSDDGSSSAALERRHKAGPWRALKVALAAGALWAVVRLLQRVRAAGGLGAVGAAVLQGEALWEHLEGVWEYLVEGVQDHLSTRIFCLAITLLVKLVPKRRRFLLDWLLD